MGWAESQELGPQTIFLKTSSTHRWVEEVFKKMVCGPSSCDSAQAIEWVPSNKVFAFRLTQRSVQFQMAVFCGFSGTPFICNLKKEKTPLEYC